MRGFLELVVVVALCAGGFFGISTLKDERDRAFEAFDREVAARLPTRTELGDIEARILEAGWRISRVPAEECERRPGRGDDLCFGGPVLEAKRSGARPWCRHLGGAGFTARLEFDASNRLTARSVENSGLWWLLAC